MTIKGNRTYATLAVIIVVALLQYFKVIDWNQETFTEVLAVLGSIAAFFIRASINK